MKTIVTWIILAILTCSFPALSMDNGSTPSQKDEASKAFRAGQELSKQGKYQQAAAAFEKAYRLQSHPSVLANIGQCYYAIGDYPRAVLAFRKYLVNPTPNVPKFNDEAKKTLNEMESKVGDLFLSCRTKNCFVDVGNFARGKTPLSLVLLPGVYDVEMTTEDGEHKKEFKVTVQAGKKNVLEADLVDSDASDSRRLRAPFWIFSAGTLVAAGTTAVLGGLNLKTIREYEDGGHSNASLRERGNRLNLSTAVVGGVTGLLGVTAIILAVVDLKRKTERDVRHKETSVVPVFGSDLSSGAFAGIRVRFR